MPLALPIPSFLQHRKTGVMNRQASPPENILPPLFRAAAIKGVKATVELYLERGIDANVTDRKGRSALILAAGKGHVGICRILLEAGANPILRDKNGDDALSIAITHGQKNVEAILREYLPSPQPATVQETPADDDAGTPTEEILSVPGNTPTSSDESGEYFPDYAVIDLTLWKEEQETLRPSGDTYCFTDAEEIQKRISDHVPVDADEDWSDIDIELPETSFPGRQKLPNRNIVWRVAARDLFLAGLHDGWVKEGHLLGDIPLDGEDQDTSEIEYLTTLRVILEDLGIQVNDDPDFLVPFQPEPNGKEAGDYNSVIEAEADQAVAFLLDLQSGTHDPLTRYLMDMGHPKVLSRNEERDLVHEIAESFRETLSALSRSPAIMSDILDRFELEKWKGVSIRSTIGSGGDTGENMPKHEEVSSFVDENEEDTSENINPAKSSSSSLVATEVSIAFFKQFDTIRTLRDAIVCAQSIADREILANQLADKIIELNISGEFAEQLWQTVKASEEIEGAQDALMHGLHRMQAAKIKFATHNLRLVKWVARKYRRLPFFMDLVQEGNIGLLRAIDRFDPDRGARFATYATLLIRQSIIRAIAEHKWLVRFPVHAMENFEKVEWALHAFIAKFGHEPKAEDLVPETGLAVNQIRLILDIPHDLLPETGTWELKPLLEAQITNLAAQNPEDIVANAGLREALENAMQRLTEREANIIKLRFGLYDDNQHTLAEVAQMYGVTRERIRQIQEKACRKLGYSEMLRAFR